MVINYTIGTNFYRTTYWKNYGIPLRVEINNQNDTGTVVYYNRVNVDSLSDSDVTLPNSQIVAIAG